jgi:hypothetical protein
LKDLVKREDSCRYYTNSDQWICSYPAFLKDRFFLCKHLVKLINNVIIPEFFNHVRRQGIYPLLGMISMISEEQNEIFIHFNTTLLNEENMENMKGNLYKIFFFI